MRHCAHQGHFKVNLSHLLIWAGEGWKHKECVYVKSGISVQHMNRCCTISLSATLFCSFSLLCNSSNIIIYYMHYIIVIEVSVSVGALKAGFFLK